MIYSDNCVYCSKEGGEVIFEDEYDYNIYIDGNKIVFNKFVEDSISLEINFCPICGKFLKL